MSQPRIQRRRFLADLLFLGGGLAAAAVLGMSSEPRTEPPSQGHTAGPGQQAAEPDYPSYSSYQGCIGR